MENPATPEPRATENDLLIGWLNRSELAEELGLSIDTLQRWETRRFRPRLAAGAGGAEGSAPAQCQGPPVGGRDR